MYFVENVEKIRVKLIIIVNSLKLRSKSSLCFFAVLKNIWLYSYALHLQIEFRKIIDEVTNIRSDAALETITDQQRCNFTYQQSLSCKTELYSKIDKSSRIFIIRFVFLIWMRQFVWLSHDCCREQVSVFRIKLSKHLLLWELNQLRQR